MQHSRPCCAGPAQPFGEQHPAQRIELPPHALGQTHGADHDRGAGRGVLNCPQRGQSLRIGQVGIGQDHVRAPPRLGQQAQSFGKCAGEAQLEPASQLAVDRERLDRINLDHQDAQGPDLLRRSATCRTRRITT